MIFYLKWNSVDLGGRRIIKKTAMIKLGEIIEYFLKLDQFKEAKHGIELLNKKKLELQTL